MGMRWVVVIAVVAGGCGDNTAATHVDAAADAWTFGSLGPAQPWPPGARIWLGGDALVVADSATEEVLGRPDIFNVTQLVVHDGLGFAIAGSPPTAYRISFSSVERIGEARALDVGTDALWLATDHGVVRIDLATGTATTLALGPQREIRATATGAWTLGPDNVGRELDGALATVGPPITTHGLRLVVGGNRLWSVGIGEQCRSTQCWHLIAYEAFTLPSHTRDVAVSAALNAAGPNESIDAVAYAADHVWALGFADDYDSNTLEANVIPFQALGCVGMTRSETEVIAACESYFARFDATDGTRTLNATQLSFSGVRAIAVEP